MIKKEISLTRDYQKYAVEKYIEQVKVLTTLASALLLSPGILAALYRVIGDHNLQFQQKQQAIVAVIISSVSSLIAIFFAYFIYSSLIGMIYKNKYDIYRPATRFFSLLQFIFVVISCVSFIFVVYYLLIS